MTNQLGGKRIEAKDMRCRERLPLHEVIPLRAPLLAYIDPASACNFRCAFCPTADLPLLKSVGRRTAVMEFALFRKVVDDLKAFGAPLKLISLYKDGEPLLNPNFPEMVRLLRDAGVAERIWTKTNGSRLTPELNEQIVDAGLHTINISVEATSADGYSKIAKVDIDYDQFRANIADLFHRRRECQVYIKIADYGLTPTEIDQFYADFQPICTHIAVEKLMGWSYSGVKDFTLGSKPTTYDGAPLIGKEVCAYPFYVLAVNADGSVSLCGNDWSQGTVVGNVANESLVEIWNGQRLFDFRRMLLEGRRNENRACGDCYYLQIVPDNIDPYRDDILNRLCRARATPLAAASDTREG